MKNPCEQCAALLVELDTARRERDAAREAALKDAAEVVRGCMFHGETKVVTLQAANHALRNAADEIVARLTSAPAHVPGTSVPDKGCISLPDDDLRRDF